MAELVVFEEKENGLVLRPHVSELLKEIDQKRKTLDQMEKDIKEAILNEMEKNQVLKLETDELVVSYVSPTYKEIFNSKALKAADEETYNKYIKISPVKSSVRVRVK